MPADDQEGSNEERSEAEGGGRGEGASEGVQQGPCGPRQLVMELAPLSADGPRLARLSPSAFASLGFGESLVPAPG
jgi:hypothetical protein